MENIGEIIKKKVEEMGLSVKDFAEALSCSESNVYSIYKRQNIDFDLLKRISKILEYDFGTALSDNNPISKYFIALEVDDSKLKEIESDSNIKIIFTKNV